MSKETLLKKEFKQSDVQRVRNLVNKDFTSGVKVQAGYRKSSKKHKSYISDTDGRRERDFQVEISKHNKDKLGMCEWIH